MTIEPIPPEALRSVPGLDTPQRFYQVLRVPAPLAGMPLPTGAPWKAFASAGFESIVCLTCDTAPYDPSPLRVLRALEFKDLVNGARPDHPQREAAMLWTVVQAVVDELRSGRGVIVQLDTKSGAVDPAVIEERGMKHVVVGIDDRPPKIEEIRAAYFAAIDQILALLEADGEAPKQTLVHCHAGLDRSPTVGICYLISRGMAPSDAIRAVCKMTGGFEYKECIATIWKWHERRDGGETRP